MKPEITELELAWLAGLLEGEGSFHKEWMRSRSRYFPVVKVAMTDLDVILRVAQMLGRSYCCFQQSAVKHGYERKPVYEVKVKGVPALTLMKQLHPFMLGRRSAKIDELLLFFNTDTNRIESGKKLLSELGITNEI